MPAEGKISEFGRGEDVEFEWSLQNFLNLLDKDPNWCVSPSFRFNGQTWFLEIHLFKSKSERHESIALNLAKYSSDLPTRQEYQLALKTEKGAKCNEEHFTRVGDLSGYYYRFITRGELLLRRSELLPSGVLTVVCTMKGKTSSGSAGTSGSSSAECCYCKKTFHPDKIISHQKKCMDRPIKCPECSEVVLLQKWLDGHECQTERSNGEDGASESSISPEVNKLRQDLKEFFFKKEDCDVIIKVDGQEFPAHRVILKARSPVLASNFRHDMKENATGILKIKDCDASIFSDFLCFLYCGDATLLPLENVFGLFTAADKYEVLDLRAKCLEFMKDNMSVDTFCDTITLALLHSETELIEFTTDYFTKNALKIIKTAKWQTFLAENPTESNELMVKLLKQ